MKALGSPGINFQNDVFIKLRTSLFLLFFQTILLNTSCRSDKPDVKPETAISTETGKGVFISNEGNFQWGNASVSYYNFSDGHVTEDVFEAANDRPLGDVCQTIELFEGKMYVVVNNSGKVEVVNPNNFKSEGAITGLNSPRCFLGINSTKAYVTDLYSNSVSVINLQTKTKTKSISCPGWTEELVLADGKAFVTNCNRRYLYIIDTGTDAIVDSIEVGEAPNSIKKDKNGKLWVLCGGNSETSVSPSLLRIDPASETVEETFTFSSGAPWKLSINGTKDTLYYLNAGLYQFPIANAALPSSALVSESGGSVFYGLGVDPHSGIVYLADALDYVQKGKIYRYKPDGAAIDNFTVGLIPNGFCFY